MQTLTKNNDGEELRIQTKNKKHNNDKIHQYNINCKNM